jgi:hypothetical protein
MDNVSVIFDVPNACDSKMFEFGTDCAFERIRILFAQTTETRFLIEKGE